MNGKKALLPFLVLVFLVPVPASFLVVKADSNNSMVLPGEVTLYSPVNITYPSNFLCLNLTFAWGAGMQCKLNYNIDNQFSSPIPLTYNDSADPGFQLFALETGYVQLPKLSNGSHQLIINIEADLNDYHGANPPGAPFKQTTPGSANWIASWIDTIDFTINSNGSDQPVSTSNLTKASVPSISNLSIENTIYNTNDIPLNFTVDTNISKAAYSLDGQSNITIAGNTTLTGLAVGAHNVTVYAWNNEGNASSQTINFEVADVRSAVVPQSQPFPTTTIIAAVSAFTVGCVLTFLLFFRKEKR